MANFSRDRVSLNIEAESASDFRAIEEDEPFRIALLGDFSGGSNRVAVASRKPVLIDRDNFEEVLAKLKPAIHISGASLRIGHLDHLHPDHIYTAHPAFREIRETRGRLGDPDTFAEAARELLGEKPAPIPSHSGGLLDLIVGESGAAAQTPKPENDLQDFIDNAMRSQLVAKQDSRAPELIGRVDGIASDTMRLILNNANFKAMEAAWRTVYWMVRKLETGVDLKIYLLDVSKEELSSNINGLYQVLVKQSDPWAVIAGNYTFGTDDLKLLGMMGQIASRAQAPFLAEADLSLLGGESQWAAFRQTAEAAHVGLALPRVLLRMPYGSETDPCELFPFEEIGGKPDAKQMLFGSPAYFAALLLGEAFTEHGWNLRPGIVREISGLPIYTYEDDGESKAFPCAEIELTEETAEALMDEGFMPLAAIRNSGSVRLIRFQSVAFPAAALPGRWQ